MNRKMFLCALVGAAMMAPDLSAALIDVGSPMGTMTLNSTVVGTVTPTGPDSFNWMGFMSNAGMGWEISWNLNIDNDPQITGASTFTSLMGTATNFTFNISSNSVVSIVNPIVNGATTISVLDTGSNGASMDALPGGSIYDAFIVSSSQQTLFNDPFSLVAPVSGVNQTGTSWGAQASTVALTNGDLFGINHSFTLSALDQATVNSSFFVVPAPSALGLFALGGMLLGSRRRRDPA